LIVEALVQLLSFTPPRAKLTRQVKPRAISKMKILAINSSELTNSLSNPYVAPQLPYDTRTEQNVSTAEVEENPSISGNSKQSILFSPFASKNLGYSTPTKRPFPNPEHTRSGNVLISDLTSESLIPSLPLHTWAPSAKHHRSSRRTSNAKSSGAGSSSAQPQQEVEQLEPPPPPSTSFLFVVNGLPLNEDVDNGGVPPRTDTYGRWLPPMYQAGFGAKSHGTVFRWRNGVISAPAGYQWEDGYAYAPNGGALNCYRSITMFYCDPFNQFLMAEGDASTRDIETSPWPGDRWFPVNFRHDDSLSRVDFTAERCLAGNGAPFIDHLGLVSYQNQDPDAPPSGGLAGNLAILIALVAFSCRSTHLRDILVHNRAWHRYRWTGHDHASGREQLSSQMH
jgi:hypothetical protein